MHSCDMGDTLIEKWMNWTQHWLTSFTYTAEQSNDGQSEEEMEMDP